MSSTITGYRPDPRIRNSIIDQIVESYESAAKQGHGHIVFLAGETGSGRTSTLTALSEVLNKADPKPTIIAGTFGGDGYMPLQVNRQDYQHVLGALGETLAVPALFIDPLIGPALGLLAQLLQAGVASWEPIQQMGSTATPITVDPALLLKRSLREAATKCPVVWIIHRIDAASAQFLSIVLCASAQELTRQRQIFVVASLDGPRNPGEHEEGESPTMYAARSLVRRKLATWLSLPPLSAEEIASWLKNADSTLVDHLYRITGGNPDWLALLWDDLWRQGKVRPHPESYCWELASGLESADLGGVHDIFLARLQRLLGETDAEEIDDILFLLACAALEGVTFTAGPVAEAMGWDTDDLIDLLDDRLLLTKQRPYGLVTEASPVIIAGTEQRALWRYQFASNLFWYALKRYDLGNEERYELSRDLAWALQAAYSSEERQIAADLARLFEEGGESEQARHYRDMTAFAGRVEAAYWQAQVLMTAATQDWETQDFAWAADLLNDAFYETMERIPYRQSLAIAEKAYQFAVTGKTSGEQGRALHNIGGVYSALGEKQKALDYYEQALPIDRQVGDRGGEASTLNNIGMVYSDLGEKQKALDYFEQALLLRCQVGDRGGEASTLNNIGLVYSALGDKQRALDYFEQALLLRCQVGDRGGEATTLNNIGSVYSSLGDKQKALDYYEQALPLYRQVGDRGGEATTLNNIGSVYDALGEKQKALEYFEQALPLFRQVGDRGGEATTLNNIGGVYDALSEKQKALHYYEQALPLYRQVGDRGGEATTLNNIGGVYGNQGEIEKALGYHEQAADLLQQIGHVWYEFVVRGNIGYLHIQQGQWTQAETQYQRTVAIGEAVGHPNTDRYRQLLAQVQAKM